MPWTLAVESSFPRGPCCFPTTCPYSCLGKEVEPRGKWVPGIVLEKEVWAGGRKENTGDGVGVGDGLLAVQMQYSFPSVTSELPTVVI